MCLAIVEVSGSHRRSFALTSHPACSTSLLTSPGKMLTRPLHLSYLHLRPAQLLAQLSKKPPSHCCGHVQVQDFFSTLCAFAREYDEAAAWMRKAQKPPIAAGGSHQLKRGQAAATAPATAAAGTMTSASEHPAAQQLDWRAQLQRKQAARALGSTAIAAKSCMQRTVVACASTAAPGTDAAQGRSSQAQQAVGSACGSVTQKVTASHNAEGEANWALT